MPRTQTITVRQIPDHHWSLPERLSRRLHGWHVRLIRFHHSEVGAAYSLAMTILLPFFTLLIVTIIETTLLLTAQLGTQYAAYAAARAATVWLPADIPEAQRLAMVHLAAVNALWPYASGSADHVMLGTGSLQPLDAGHAVIRDAYERFAAAPRAPDHTTNKWQYAARNTRVSVNRLTEDFDSPIEVTVEYDRPFFIGVAGMMFGNRTESGRYTRTLSHTVTLLAAGSRAADGKLGIQYDRRYGFHSSAAALAGNGSAERLTPRAASVESCAANPRSSRCQRSVLVKRRGLAFSP